ncbi:tetratricopeptide repeat protein, partial [Actinomadura sp. NTSP31]|uniref:tetratricopeptide repeat protein n=1 Tax=Actinomadura sp. NTSP31 TaxID=1735447 RepID=UPI0035BF5FCC
QLAQNNPERYLPDLATSLTNLGVTLSELGRLDEALPVTEEAVRIRRQLAQNNPERYLPDLATSLTNLGVTLSEHGREEEAQQAWEEIRRLGPSS